MPIETINYEIKGANAKTGSIQINVNNGSGTGTVVVNGVNSGVDSVTATMASHSLTSNEAQIGWQATNGQIALLANPTGYFWAAANQTQGFARTDVSSPLWSQTLYSLMFNVYPLNLLPGNPFGTNAILNPTNPPRWLNFPVTAGGNFSPIGSGAGGTVICEGNGYTAGSGSLLAFDMIITGSFVVSEASQINFSPYFSYALMGGIGGGATKISGPAHVGVYTASTTPMKGYPLLFEMNSTYTEAESEALGATVINFPAAGIYPFEFMYWIGTQAGGLTLSIVAPGNSVIAPVASVTMPPSGPAASGDLQLSPVLAGPDVIGTAQSLTVTAQNIAYQTQTYVGLLEGTSGKVYVWNTGSASSDTGNSFVLPTIDGNTIPASTAASLFSLTGDNGTWKGLVSLAYDGTGYALEYNGGAIPPKVAKTTLTVSQQDPAWYNATATTLDAFVPTSQGGGQFLNVEVDYLVNASVASVTPTTVPGDGQQHTFTISLAKPLPPLQAGTACTVTLGGSGLSSPGTVSPVVDQDGYTTAYTVPITVSSVASPSTATIGVALSGTISYMNGSTATTGSVTYYNNSSAGSVIVSVASIAPPTNISLSASPLPIGTSTTLTAKLQYGLDNFGTLTFYAQASNNFGVEQNARIQLGTVSSPTVAQSGSLYIATYSFTADTAGLFDAQTWIFGYSETQTDGQNVTYWSSTYNISSNVTPEPTSGGSSGPYGPGGSTIPGQKGSTSL